MNNDFHIKDGWYFGARDDGRVYVYNVNNPDAILKMDADSWVSVIAHMSERGRHGEYPIEEARDLHTEGPSWDLNTAREWTDAGESA